MGRVPLAVERRGQEGEARRGQAHADPLPARDPMGEEAVGDDGEHHQAAGDGRLDQRDRSQRQGPDVQAPATHRDQHAERVPAGPEEDDRAPQRPAPVDGRALDGASMLVEEADDRGERGGDREQQSQLNAERHPVSLKPKR
jgi:hypothetical protein